MRIFLLIGMVFLLVSSNTAFGETIQDDQKDDDGWHFVLKPLYIWGVSIDGSTTLPDSGGGGDVFPLSSSSITGAFTFHFEAGKNKWTMFTDYLYAEYTTKDVTGQLGLLKGQNVLTAHVVELGGAYSLIDKNKNKLEALAGLRFLDIENIFTFDLDIFSPLTGSADIWDGFVGGRYERKLFDGVSAKARGDIGAGDSDLVWNIILSVDWRFKKWGSVYAGYRWLDYDFTQMDGNEEFGINLTAEGPAIGLGFYW